MGPLAGNQLTFTKNALHARLYASMVTHRPPLQRRHTYLCTVHTLVRSVSRVDAHVLVQAGRLGETLPTGRALRQKRKLQLRSPFPPHKSVSMSHQPGGRECLYFSVVKHFGRLERKKIWKNSEFVHELLVLRTIVNCRDFL